MVTTISSPKPRGSAAARDTWTLLFQLLLSEREFLVADAEGAAFLARSRCGCGGALKDGVIEIQGDHVELLLEELSKRGFKAKKSGG